MTQEQRELLVKDLCGRLPYGVKFRYKYINNFFHEDYATEWLKGVLPPYHIMHSTRDEEDYLKIDDDEVRPYLFPLSSMTEEQKNNCPIGETNLNIIKSNIGYGIIEIPWQLSYIFIEWCNKNHFDYMGLISKGLAIDASGLNIY